VELAVGVPGLFSFPVAGSAPYAPTAVFSASAVPAPPMLVIARAAASVSAAAPRARAFAVLSIVFSFLS